MKCLIIDKVYAGIAEELSKYMEVKTADNLPSTKAQVIADIADVDVLIMRVDPKIDQEIIDAAMNSSLKTYLRVIKSIAAKVLSVTPKIAPPTTSSKG